MARLTIGALLLAALALAAVSCTTAPVREAAEHLQPLPVQASDSGEAAPPSETLIVASLNLAHGRRDAINQAFVSEEETRNNLRELAGYFRRGGIHVAAVQEADAPSRWSGDFDHVAYVAQHAAYPWFAHAVHSRSFAAQYGTGLMSRLPLREAWGFSFAPTPPSTTKGFTLATIDWHHDAGSTPVDVVSVHLDFSRESVRRRQLDELGQVLGARDKPLVMMGDFNTESILERLQAAGAANGRGLHAWPEPEPTYNDKRLDWIILSRELEFVRHVTGREVLSDHRPVFAELRLASRPTTGETAP